MWADNSMPILYGSIHDSSFEHLFAMRGINYDKPRIEYENQYHNLLTTRKSDTVYLGCVRCVWYRG